MRKIYSLVLMATMLLVSTNIWAATHQVGTIGELETAWASAASGDVIQLTAPIQATKTFWLGTERKDATNPRSLTLDLNGFVLSNNNTGTTGVRSMFVISHGELNITTSVPGGQISGSNYYHHDASGHGNIQDMFFITGTDATGYDASLTPESAGWTTWDAAYFSHLTIGEGVVVNAQYQQAIVVDYIDNFWSLTSSNSVAATGTTRFGVDTTKAGNFRGVRSDVNYFYAAPYQFKTNAEARYNKSGHACLANGVRLDVYGKVYAQKYGMKINGWVQKPDNKDDAAYVHIYNTAYIYSENSAAVYSSGYGRWLIEGECEGKTGVHIKGGEVVFNDATIKSNYNGDFSMPNDGTGVSGSGSAIVVHSTSNTDYAGYIEVTITGDTKATATNGYALEEVITKPDYAADGETRVTKVEIDGGTFEGGNVGTQQNPVEGTIIITDKTVQNSTVVVSGGQVSGNANIGEDDLATYLAGQGGTHITYVDNGKGGTTMVISEGQAPTGQDNVMGHAGESVNWKHTALGNTDPMTEDINDNYSLAELEINQSYNQTLTVKAPYTLTVGRVVLGPKAQIIVEAGAKFIVTGEQGIVAPVVENIVLKTSATQHATFLFHPAVTSNRHPNATVQYVSKSFVNTSSDYQWERLGIPTWNQLKGVESTIKTAVAVFENDGWTQLGFIMPSTPFANIDKLDKPFVTYNTVAYRTQQETAATLTFKGELVGNDNPVLNANREWNGYPNSFMADVDAAALLTGLSSAANIDKTIYLPHYQGNGYYTWDPIDSEWISGQKIAPMQAFILRNGSADAEATTINYNDAVWSPATSAAPARRMAANDNSAKMRIVVTNENGVWDNVKMTESATNSNNAVKYMNDDVNIYATSDAKYGIVANDNLEDTYLGFSTVKGGEFTISFTNVAGREFDLIDLETGARVAANEGETYTFHMDANTTNDYRFKVVERKVATAMENTEAVKSAKGIYTITGQYVGEMNVWNSLPAGVYVINGAKCVK